MVEQARKVEEVPEAKVQATHMSKNPKTPLPHACMSSRPHRMQPRIPLTDIIAKRSNTISELITFRIAKAKAKVKFGVKYLCKHECERSSVPINISTKAKATIYLGQMLSR